MLFFPAEPRHLESLAETVGTLTPGRTDQSHPWRTEDYRFPVPSSYIATYDTTAESCAVVCAESVRVLTGTDVALSVRVGGGGCRCCVLGSRRRVEAEVGGGR